MPPFFFDEDVYKLLESGDKIYTEFLVSPKTKNLIKIIEEYVSSHSNRSAKKQWALFTSKEFDLSNWDDWRRLRNEANLCIPWVVSVYRTADGQIVEKGHDGFDKSYENLQILNKEQESLGLPLYQLVGRPNDVRAEEWRALL